MGKINHPNFSASPFTIKDILSTLQSEFIISGFSNNYGVTLKRLQENLLDILVVDDSRQSNQWFLSSSIYNNLSKNKILIKGV